MKAFLYLIGVGLVIALALHVSSTPLDCNDGNCLVLESTTDREVTENTTELSTEPHHETTQVEEETTTESEPETTPEPVPTTSGPSTTLRPPHLCPVDDPMEPPNDQCDPDEEFPTYLPYPYDCAKYFQCANGMAICQRCPNGTIWSQADTVCVRNGSIPCDPPTTTPRGFVVNEYSIINFFKKLFY